jgi:P2 family phage contractile tail tube protein
MPRNEGIISFSVYEDAKEYLGIAKATRPDIKFMTQSLSGAGIAGNITAVMRGLVEAMQLALDFTETTDAAVNLLTPVTHHIDLRVAMQEFDPVKSQYNIVSEKYLMDVVPQQLGGGSVAQASASDVSGQYSVYNYKAYKNGKELWCIDPINYICRIGGVDYLADVRKALGK